MRKFLFFSVGFLFSFLSSAEYLNWQVSATDMKSGYLATLPSDGQYMAVLRYGASDSTDYANWFIAKDAIGSVTPFYNGEQYDISETHAETFYDGPNTAEFDLSQFDGQNVSFYIEVWKYNDVKQFYEGVARSEIKTYGELSGGGQGGVTYTSVDYDALEFASVWHGSSYSIPDPTSAMLLMIGLSLVGLKRKRA